MSNYNSKTHPLHTYVHSGRSAVKSFQYDNEETNAFFPSYVRYPKKLYSKIPKKWEPQYDHWKDLLIPAENQGSCGSCWAYSVVNTLTDRYNIWSNKKIIQSNLSPFLILTCNVFATFFKNQELVKNLDYETWNKQTGCYGNILLASILYIYCFGVSTKNCFPYDIDDLRKFKDEDTNYSFNQPSNANIKLFNTTFDFSKFAANVSITPSCSFATKSQRIPFQVCQNFINIDETTIYGSVVQNFSITHFYQVPAIEQQIQLEILSNGPVVSAFLVYNDFYLFDAKNKIYAHEPDTSESPLGGHAVEIVGWGEEKNIPFWWIKNTWGPEYGINGYFRFRRGNNMCHLEENVHGFFPDMFINYQDFNLIRKIRKSMKNKKYIHEKKADKLPPLINKVIQFIFENTHKDSKSETTALTENFDISPYFKQYGTFALPIYTRSSIQFLSYSNNYLGFFAGIHLPFEHNYVKENLPTNAYFKTLYGKSLNPNKKN